MHSIAISANAITLLCLSLNYIYINNYLNVFYCLTLNAKPYLHRMLSVNRLKVPIIPWSDLVETSTVRPLFVILIRTPSHRN